MLSLLFGFHGRINRAKYWFGTLLSNFGCFVGAGMIMAISSGAALDATSKGAKVAALTTGLLLMTPVFALASWSGLAIQVKRFHDRGRSGWLVAIPFVAMLMLVFTIIDGIANSLSPVELGANLEPYMAVFSLIGLGFFIDLGCLPGVDGPNKHGDPPGSSGMSSPHNAPSAAAVSTLLGAQAAMDRAVAQRDTLPVAAKAPAPAQAPGAAFAPGAATPAGPRGFGRRATR